MSTVRERVSAPITKHLFAKPAFIYADDCITPSTHPGQPKIKSYATQFGFSIANLCLTKVATEGKAIY